MPEFQLQYPYKAGENTVVLAQIIPIIRINEPKVTVCKYFIDEIEQTVRDNETVYANKIVFTASNEGTLELILGHGYVAKKDEEWTKALAHTDRWCGGDGIFTFNLTDGNDSFDQNKPVSTLFIFGDTLIGRFDRKTKQRMLPIVMVNNSMAVLEKDKKNVEFLFKSENDGTVTGFFKIDPKYDVKGTPVNNLTVYDQTTNEGWLSGYDPKDLYIVFDLATIRRVTKMVISNYYNQNHQVLSTRGVKQVRVSVSSDGKVWNDLGEYEIAQNIDGNVKSDISVNKEFRYLKLSVNDIPGIGNYNDSTREGLFGLNKVEFFDNDRQYLDVSCKASSTLLQEPARSWLWLQDGVVVNNCLYSFPLTVVTDLNQPEGLQFGISGINQIKVPIKNEKLLLDQQTQKRTPFFFKAKEAEISLGGAIMNCTNDGYVYVYGYQSVVGLRRMIVSRVKAAEIDLFDSYEFYDGEKYVKDIRKAVPVLDHISCEFSVSKLENGRNKGKYLCVFTTDVNTPYVAFSIGDTPQGPFTDPQIIYKAPEPEMYGETTYTYNAKAHPHLSESKSVLVTYNTNTFSFDHNMRNADIYNPRFIRLNEI